MGICKGRDASPKIIGTYRTAVTGTCEGRVGRWQVEEVPRKDMQRRWAREVAGGAGRRKVGEEGEVGKTMSEPVGTRMAG
jgi:hypothetical protein